MKPSVYIETTIISYIVADPSRDLVVAAHQQLTSEWWKTARPKVDCFVSTFVVEEAGRGDKFMAPRRLALIQNFALLEVNESIAELASKYFEALNIPDRSRIDSFHLAVAAWHKMDYLLSWNCKHIASGRVQKIIRSLNEKLGFHTPIVCTPEELMEV